MRTTRNKKNEKREMYDFLKYTFPMKLLKISGIVFFVGSLIAASAIAWMYRNDYSELPLSVLFVFLLVFFCSYIILTKKD